MKLDNMLDLKVLELVNNNKCPSKSLEFLTSSNSTLDLDRMDIKGTALTKRLTPFKTWILQDSEDHHLSRSTELKPVLNSNSQQVQLEPLYLRFLDACLSGVT